MLNRGSLSRRGFLQRSLTGLTAAGLPAWYANELLIAAEEKSAAKKPRAANDRLNVGIVGIDNKTRRSVALYHEANKLNAKGKADVVNFVALCDVDATHLKNGQEMLKKDGHETKGHKDFREMLGDKSIDAVLIAVPDQWHALIAVEAMKQGKDVYCEKPLTLTIDEGKKLVASQKKTGRVFQTGSQQRSEMGGKFRLAAEVVRAGRLGKIGRIECRIGTNPKSGPIAKAPVPEGLDWDMWLGPCPKVDFLLEQRGNQTLTNCHYEYRWWYQYSGGKMTDWGAHHLDIAQWALGMDGNGPIEVDGHGEAPAKDPTAYNCHPTFEVTYTYANGSKVIAVSHDHKKDKRFTDNKYGNGLIIEGENGKWVFVSRGTIEASDKAILSEPLPANFKPLYDGRPVSHMANFVDCVKSRKDPICPVGVGFSSVTVCHIGTISTRLGKKLRWDPLKQEFLGDTEASAMLSRPMRSAVEVGGVSAFSRLRLRHVAGPPAAQQDAAAPEYNRGMREKRSETQRTKVPRWYRGANIPRGLIRRFAREVAERFRPDKIVLFGSYAYGEPHADSDVDMLVVMPARNELDQAVKICLAVDYQFPLDLLVRTPENLSWRLADGDSFLREVMDRGKVLYEKTDGGLGAQGQRPTTASRKSSPGAGRQKMTSCVFAANRRRRSFSRPSWWNWACRYRGPITWKTCSAFCVRIVQRCIRSGADCFS